MKIGVSSYSFHQAVSAGHMSTYDIVDAAAKMGFEEIDFAVLLGDDPLEKMCKKLGKQAKDAGIGVSNYAVAADFLNKNLDEEVERVKGELRNAVLLGARTLRHDAAWKLPEDGSIRTFRQALPRIAEGCRRVTEYAETLGIRTMTENHGTFVQESARKGCGRDGAAGLPCPCQGFPLQALHGAQSRQGLVRHAWRRVPARHGDRPRRGAGGSLPAHPQKCGLRWNRRH